MNADSKTIFSAILIAFGLVAIPIEFYRDRFPVVPLLILAYGLHLWRNRMKQTTTQFLTPKLRRILAGVVLFMVGTLLVSALFELL